MLKVLTRVRADHDWRLLLLGAAICVAAAAALITPARRAGPGRVLERGPSTPEDAEPADERVEAQDAALVGGRILLAEPDDIGAALAGALLEAAGYQVIRVENGAQAVRAARDWSFDLILMSLRMPILDGPQAARMIRDLDGRAGTPPIVALATDATRADREACLAAGMDDVLSKPFVAEALLDAVTRRLTEEGDAMRARRQARAEPPDLDSAQLDSLARLLPPGQLEAVARGHMEQISELLDRMSECLEAGDLKLLAPAAHACRGSWAEFGGRRVQHLAARLERACRDGDGEAAARLVGQVRHAAAEAAMRLEDYLAARPAGRRTV
ncbi:MAG TPA: response regulator [Caulobacteraceae bacterium]|nr:response regulator [Caulobacteraceae bacterium]